MISAHTSSTVKLQQQSQHTKRAVVCRPRHRSSSLRVSAAAAAAPPAAAAPAADAVAQVVADEAQFVLQTYARPADVVFVRGEGSKLYDLHGKEYLDLAAGACVYVYVWLWACGRVDVCYLTVASLLGEHCMHRLLAVEAYVSVNHHFTSPLVVTTRHSSPHMYVCMSFVCARHLLVCTQALLSMPWVMATPLGSQP